MTPFVIVLEMVVPENTARRHGGALRVNRESYVSITNCKFVGNHVEEFDSTGGAISVPYRGTLVLEDSYFSSTHFTHSWHRYEHSL